MDFPQPTFIPFDFHQLPDDEQSDRAEEFFRLLERRRTVRDYSDRDVPIELIRTAIRTAGTAPSGANMQPWRFVVVRDADIKRKIRARRSQDVSIVG